MPTRTITSAAIASSLASTDYKGGSSISFTVSSDTGLNENAASVSAARLTISSFKSYATTYYLNVLFDGTVVGQTAAMTSNSSTHSETMTLSSLSSALITAHPSEITLAVVSTSGTGNKINFREGCTITLEVDYIDATACGAPGKVAVANTLTHDATTLYWTNAASGVGNAICGYNVQRCEYDTSQGTWNSWETIHYEQCGTTYGTITVSPPDTYGNYYAYRVQTCGTAGEAYYSDWTQSSNTLRRDHAPLEDFTDTLTAGTTPVKALHMQELQDRVATLRTFYGLGAYGFSTITAGETSLAGWSTHVAEIREAVDGIGKSHETWLTITENKPRADVMQQLRDVVLSI